MDKATASISQTISAAAENGGKKMRLIDADALREKAEVIIDEYYDDHVVVYAEDVDNAPTISPDSLRPRGRWIVKTLVDTELLLPHCSECDKPHAREWNFCNECGADMREDG